MRIQPTNGPQLELRWVQVRDENGRPRMEARWALAPQATAATASTPHAA